MLDHSESAHLFHRLSDHNFLSNVRGSLKKATDYTFARSKPDGHWAGEIRSNVTITAEYVFLYQSLGKAIPGGSESVQKFILSQQNADGSWSLAPDYAGDVSTSSEAYLALKMLGMSKTALAMRAARSFILKAGGVAKVRIFTRIFFAQFGLFPWDAVPQLPAEFVLLMAASPVNIYAMASWARSTVIPMLIIRHHEKIYPIQNVTGRQDVYLDELWLDSSSKMVPYSPSLIDLWDTDFVTIIFTAADKLLWALKGMRYLPTRYYARRQCIHWILSRQEKQGDWAGIVIPMNVSIQALLLEGYKFEDAEVQRGLQAIERFAVADAQGKRIQPCVSPTWDTVLMVQALCDADIDPTDPRLRLAAKWIKSRQNIGPEGDWRINNPKLQPGGFSFEHFNTWYPDTDDTTAAILALVKHNPSSIDSSTVSRAAHWICGMQNSDGGWGAFDRQNNKLWLNRIPFSDMNALCDPSTADVTGHILEAFALILETANHEFIDPALHDKIAKACEGAIWYLHQQQESTGAWFGRWGSNYIYGTSGVLCGLAYFAKERVDVKNMVDDAISWLRYIQNQDGGWGEGLDSYKEHRRAGIGPSTPSQTAWALMALIPYVDPDDDTIKHGIEYLLRTQTDVDEEGNGASWPERLYTGTGFPEHFYFGYEYYRHYFPMMALGRYLKVLDGKERERSAEEIAPDMPVLGKVLHEKRDSVMSI
ncbi:terpene cyclase [Venturia effusa]|uniref:Terpene cyclase/mutase family member n=1 Tax=Venturia effusa TaxID=50376 RepID=A0A517L1G0_9PEZI|nr:terpene cyclase [Venturia effusa]